MKSTARKIPRSNQFLLLLGTADVGDNCQVSKQQKTGVVPKWIWRNSPWW